jgi:hypothetical protein
MLVTYKIANNEDEQHININAYFKAKFVGRLEVFELIISSGKRARKSHIHRQMNLGD